MGKETKIGLAVLAVLLLVFAVVLGRRLTRPSVETAEATRTGQEKAPDGGEVFGRGRQIDVHEHRREKATVLSPTTLSAGAAKRPPDDATTSWTTASDPPKKSSTATVAVKNWQSDIAHQTPYVPAAPIPASPADDRYAVASDAATAPPAAAAAGRIDRAAARVDAASPIAAKEPSDPFHSRSDRSVSTTATTTGTSAAARIEEPLGPAPREMEDPSGPGAATRMDEPAGAGTATRNGRSFGRLDAPPFRQLLSVRLIVPIQFRVFVSRLHAEVVVHAGLRLRLGIILRVAPLAGASAAASRATATPSPRSDVRFQQPARRELTKSSRTTTSG